MATTRIRKNYHLMVDGVGYAGQVEEFTPPKLTVKTEDYQAGGMAAPIAISMGLEKLETEFTVIGLEPSLISKLTVREGSNTLVTVREVLEDYDGTLSGAMHTMRGKVIESDAGNVKSGDKSSLKIKMALRYYKLSFGATIAQEIDVENMIHIQNGVDVLSGMRNLLGR